MRSLSLDLFHEELLNWPNAITMVRVILGLFVFGFAAYSADPLWGFAGLGLHWVLDGLDGFLARFMKQETRFGAQIDIIADRAMVSFFYVIYLQANPNFLVPIVGYLVVYAFIDQYLSNQFVHWGLLSPNYFYQVDRRIWLLNWSTPGKFVNSGMFTILLLGTGSVAVSTAWLDRACGSKAIHLYQDAPPSAARRLEEHLEASARARHDDSGVSQAGPLDPSHLEALDSRRSPRSMGSGRDVAASWGT